MIFTYTAVAQANDKMTREAYISKYESLAIRQMNVSGIPASIIMAQACLESDNGNSSLAVEANNHFGIKCHTTWDGEVIYHDDDKQQECFRKYDTPEGSFFDHSDFLRYRNRYAFLFDLPSTDYQAWAHGLKKAGYATNPAYAELLIKIIEDNNLQELDKSTTDVVKAGSKTLTAKNTQNQGQVQKQGQKQKPQLVEVDTYIYEIHRRISKRNGVKYILARENETYAGIAKELGIKPVKLQKYNDAYDHPMAYGEVVYIQSKNRKNSSKKPIHIVEKGETMHSISQYYAVRLDKLYIYNGINSWQEPKIGDEIYLRKNKRRQ
jgi:LysM repeat protein